jgi:hypothetical protein
MYVPFRGINPFRQTIPIKGFETVFYVRTVSYVQIRKTRNMLLNTAAD